MYSTPLKISIKLYDFDFKSGDRDTDVAESSMLAANLGVETLMVLSWK